MNAGTPWVVRAQSRGPSRLRLLCFPYAGGGASVFRAWHGALPDDVEICAVQLPGRENRIAEMPHARLSSLLAPLADGLRPLLATDFAVFGHSMGALIGFEFARYVRNELGLEPVHLFVSSHKAPQLTKPDRRGDGLREDEVLDELRRLDGTPREIIENDELRRLVLTLMGADLSICRTYEYAPDDRLDCGISAFGGLSDREVSRSDLAAWRAHTSGSFTLRMVPGGHFFIRDGAMSLLRAISRDLEPYVDPAVLELQRPGSSRTVTHGADT
jgi:surfactin synthase thioesterase subunit